MLSLKFYLVYLYFQWHRQVINWFLNQQLESRSPLVAIMVLELSLFFIRKEIGLGNFPLETSVFVIALGAQMQMHSQKILVFSHPKVT